MAWSGVSLQMLLWSSSLKIENMDRLRYLMIIPLTKLIDVVKKFSRRLVRFINAQGKMTGSEQSSVRIRGSLVGFSVYRSIV